MLEEAHLEDQHAPSPWTTWSIRDPAAKTFSFIYAPQWRPGSVLTGAREKASCSPWLIAIKPCPQRHPSVRAPESWEWREG